MRDSFSSPVDHYNSRCVRSVSLARSRYRLFFVQEETKNGPPRMTFLSSGRSFDGGNNSKRSEYACRRKEQHDRADSHSGIGLLRSGNVGGDYLTSPSCPYDALMVGNANAAVNDFTVSDVTPLIVVSITKCGGLLFRIDAL